MCFFCLNFKVTAKMIEAMFFALSKLVIFWACSGQSAVVASSGGVHPIAACFNTLYRWHGGRPAVTYSDSPGGRMHH
ncbi:hypothetical protein BJX61DRAFT_489610 [Aspergillus egyptiacus]|nr:hypothetical protein BJX61DRAFT_489610 [Aspergillus egyptiacus]